MPRHGHPTAPTPATPAPQPAAATVRHVVDVNLNLNVTGLADVFGGAGVADRLDQILSLVTQQDSKMSKLDDALAALEQSVTDAEARDQADHATLQQQIADLQARIDAGAPNADALAERVTALKARIDALDPNAGGTTTTTPPDQTQPPAPDQGGAPAA